MNCEGNVFISCLFGKYYVIIKAYKKYFRKNLKGMIIMKPFVLSEYSFNPFNKIGIDWMLVSAGNENEFNMMTASWGGVGIMWHKQVAFVFIRPQRHTKTFVDSGELFTLSFYDKQYKPALNFCGSRSGRDYDKVKETGLTPVFVDGTVTFEQAEITLVCKKMYAQEMAADFALTADVTINYPNNDYHTMYVAEIIKAYSN